MQPTCGDTKGRTALLSSVDNENAGETDTKDNSGHSEGRLSCSGIIFTDQPCSENSAWSDDGVLGGSLSPLAECLKWNKGEGDVVLLFFFLFWGHCKVLFPPACLSLCIAARLPASRMSLWKKKGKKKKKLFGVLFCSFVLVVANS